MEVLKKSTERTPEDLEKIHWKVRNLAHRLFPGDSKKENLSKGKDIIDNVQTPQADQAVLEELQDMIDDGYDFADDAWSTGIVIRAVRDFINSHVNWDSDKVRVSAASLIWTEIANTVDGKLSSANDLETKHGVAGTYGELISLKTNLGDVDDARVLFEANLDDIVSCAPHVVENLCHLSPEKTAAAITSFVKDYLSRTVAVGAIDVDSWEVRALNWYISVSLEPSKYGKRNLDDVIPAEEIVAEHEAFFEKQWQYLNVLLKESSSEKSPLIVESLSEMRKIVERTKKLHNAHHPFRALSLITHGMHTYRTLLEHPDCGVEGLSLLVNEYGLKHFYRYPPELLIRQVQKHAESTHYGLVVTADADHNGAFFSSEVSNNIIGKLATQLQEHGYELKLTEVGSKRDIARRMIGLNKTYETNKISFLLFQAHGTSSSMILSDNERVSLPDFSIENTGVKKAETFFTEDAITVLNACSTGVKDGIANQMANFYGSKIIGPDAVASTEKIDIIFDEEGVIIDVKVKYSGAEANAYVRER